MNSFRQPLLILTFSIFVQFLFLQFTLGTPVSSWGRLKVVNKQLCSETGVAVQLKGMSTHGIQWFSNCYTQASFNALVDQWGCNIIRVVVYPAESGGYNTDRDGFKTKVDNMVSWCAAKGVYCLIDWHVLNPGDPNDQSAYYNASEFWQYMSNKHKNDKHVLYEICNEPNGTAATWTAITTYANNIIPKIRANDPNTVIIVGTPNWSLYPGQVVGKELSYTNIMYAFHFYAATHNTSYYTNMKSVLGKIPVFATEWGTSQSSGTGTIDLTASDTWLAIFDGNNSGCQKVSWCNWSFSDKGETSAALNANSCGSSNWNNTTASGTYVKKKIKETPASYLPATAGTISGNKLVTQGDNNVVYSITPITNATSYVWTLFTGATGDGSTSYTTNINFSSIASSGVITVAGQNVCGVGPSSSLSITVNPLTYINSLISDNEKNVNIYPNPLTEKNLTIETNGFINEENLNIIIRDVNGRQVYNQLKSNSSKINISLEHILQSGVYFMTISGQTQTQTKKLVVN